MNNQSHIRFPVRELTDGTWRVVIPPLGISDRDHVDFDAEDDARALAGSWLLWSECVNNPAELRPATETLQRAAAVCAKCGFGGMERFFKSVIRQQRALTPRAEGARNGDRARPTSSGTRDASPSTPVD